MKAFYLEAVATQPGRAAPSGEALNRWLFHQTTLGDVIYKVRDRVSASDDRRVNWMRGALVPAVLAERPGDQETNAAMTSA